MRLGTEQSLCQSYIHIVITLHISTEKNASERPTENWANDRNAFLHI